MKWVGVKSGPLVCGAAVLAFRCLQLCSGTVLLDSVRLHCSLSGLFEYHSVYYLLHRVVNLTQWLSRGFASFIAFETGHGSRRGFYRSISGTHSKRSWISSK